jgi:hypothetical protein
MGLTSFGKLKTGHGSRLLLQALFEKAWFVTLPANSS